MHRTPEPQKSRAIVPSAWQAEGGTQSAAEGKVVQGVGCFSSFVCPVGSTPDRTQQRPTRREAHPTALPISGGVGNHEQERGSF